MWRELWWKMAGEVKSEYDNMKQTDVFEFWKLFDMWQAKLEREKQHYKQLNNSRKNGR